MAGLGRAGVYQLERLGLRDDFQVVAVHDHCPQAADRLPRGDFRFCPDWRDLLRDPEIDLIWIAIPPAAHAGAAVAALHAGKHVVVEAPLCLTADEADAVLAAAARTGRVVSVAPTRHHDENFRAALAARREGVLGRVRSIRHLNWHFAGPRARSNTAGPISASGRQSVSHWRDDRSTGGGALWDFGAHLFDQLLQLTDERPVRIFAKLVPHSECPTVDVAFLVMIEFDGGLVASLDVNRASPAPVSTGWIIAGDAGAFSGGTQYLPTAEGEIVDLPQSCEPPENEDYLNAFFQLVRSGRPNPTSAEEARRCIVLVNAARRSAACGLPVPIEF